MRGAAFTTYRKPGDLLAGAVYGLKLERLKIQQITLIP
jgi:hypothetical protein